jgi:UDP-glucose 4-epimerase
MKNILITGGLGFIGTALARKLIEENKVKLCILLDNFGGYVNPSIGSFYDYRKLRLKAINKSKYKIERTDTNNFKSVLSIIRKYKPEVIYHTAALPLAKVSNVNADEAKQGSIDSTINLIDAVNISLKENELKRFVYISSSMVYGDFKKNSVMEDDTKRPKESYGIMKYCGEKITEGLCKLYGLKYSIIRPSAVYGPTDMNRRVSQLFMEGARKNKKLIVEGGEEKLDFTYIEDLVDGLILAATKNKGINEIFNITYGKGRRLLDFIKILKKYYPNLNYEIKPKDKSKPSRGTLSINKAKKLLGYKPKINLEKGIKKYIDFLNRI